MKLTKSHKILLKTKPEIDKIFILADRVWTCECGAKHERDVNAAINLVNKCYEPTVGGSWTRRVKRSKAPVETSSGLFTMGIKRMPAYANA